MNKCIQQSKIHITFIHLHGLYPKEILELPQSQIAPPPPFRQPDPQRCSWFFPSALQKGIIILMLTILVFHYESLILHRLHETNRTRKHAGRNTRHTCVVEKIVIFAIAVSWTKIEIYTECMRSVLKRFEAEMGRTWPHNILLKYFFKLISFLLKPFYLHDSYKNN